MVTVSSAFISSRRERIRFSVLSASGCACKAAAGVDVLRAVFGALGKTRFDNTDGVARDHSFHCIAGDRIRSPGAHTTHVGLKVSMSSVAVTPPATPWSFYACFQLPSGFLRPVEDRLSFSPVRKAQAGGLRSASRLAR